MGKFIDLTGNKYGRLTVISYSHSKHKGSAHYWNCICDCGNNHTTRSDSLKSGGTTSCGCVKRESHTKTIRNDFRTNYSHLPEYRIWEGMRRRCHNPSNKYYYNYGERGIFVCDEWKNSFEKFYFDMGPRPTNQHTIERVNNDKGYNKENCIWLHKSKQARNKRNTVRLIFNGEKTTLTDLIEKYNLNGKSVWSKIEKGHSAENAITHFLERQNEQ